MHTLLIANRFFFISVNIWVDMVNIMTYYETMISLNINEIKTHFSSFLAKVKNGETVIVCKRNVPIAEIKPIAALPDKKRPIGLAGKEYPDFEISDAFFEPLPDDIVAAFNGEDS
jgi:antitoxin (DNA-binding transcriptional repressor) of toxin-antitoxin stability system